MKKFAVLFIVICMSLICFAACTGGSGHKHTYSEEWTYDAEYHWHEATCGHESMKNYEPHNFQNGKCVCGATSTNTDIPGHTHTYGEWQSDETNHWHVTTCTEHDPMIIDSAKHTFVYSVCRVCNAYHEHEHSYVDGKCVFCNADEPPHVHKVAEEWSSDGDHHWHATTCTEHAPLKQDLTLHTFVDRVCSECGHSQFATNKEVAGNYYQAIIAAGSTNNTVDKANYINLTEDGNGTAVIKGNMYNLAYTLNKNEIVLSVITEGNQPFFEHSIVKNGVIVADESTYFVKDGVDAFLIENDVLYGLGLDGNRAVITASKTLTNVTLKNDIDGVNVTSIGYHAFESAGALAQVTLPHYLESIGECAFMYCESLRSISLPQTLKSIGERAFAGCNSLASADIPSRVTEIGASAFDNCNALTSATIPSGVTVINNGTFNRCAQLATLTIGENVASIGDGAFNQCENLLSVVIPGSVKSIGNSAFRACSKLASLTLNSGLETIGDEAFEFCTEITELNLPDTLQKFYPNSFGGMTSNGFPKLATLTVDPENKTYVSVSNCVIERATKKIIKGCKGSVIPNDANVATAIGISAFASCDFTTAPVIPETITSIEEQAFWSTKGYNTITIPSSITELKTAVFAQSYITSIVIPSNVTVIGESAFYMCSALASVTIEGEVTEIGKYAFMRDAALKKIVLPASLTKLGDMIFASCNKLEVEFKGERSAWTTLTAGLDIFSGATECTVKCSDDPADEG